MPFLHRIWKERETLLNPKQLTQAGLFLCGIAGIVLTVCIILPESAEKVTRSFYFREYYTQIPLFLSMIVAPGISFGTSYYLISKCETIAKGLFPDPEHNSVQIERAIYRVALTAVAVLILAEALPHFLHAFGISIVEQYRFQEMLYVEHSFSVLNAPFLISFLFKVLIGTYLLFGAPHLVEWQMDRSNTTARKAKKYQFGISHLIIATVLVALALGLLANGLNFASISG